MIRCLTFLLLALPLFSLPAVAEENPSTEVLEVKAETITPAKNKAEEEPPVNADGNAGKDADKDSGKANDGGASAKPLITLKEDMEIVNTLQLIATYDGLMMAVEDCNIRGETMSKCLCSRIDTIHLMKERYDDLIKAHPEWEGAVLSFTYNDHAYRADMPSIAYKFHAIEVCKAEEEKYWQQKQQEIQEIKPQ